MLCTLERFSFRSNRCSFLHVIQWRCPVSVGGKRFLFKQRKPIGRAAQDANADQAWTYYADTGSPVFATAPEQTGAQCRPHPTNPLTPIQKPFFPHSSPRLPSP